MLETQIVQLAASAVQPNAGKLPGQTEVSSKESVCALTLQEKEEPTMEECKQVRMFFRKSSTKVDKIEVYPSAQIKNTPPQQPKKTYKKRQQTIAKPTGKAAKVQEKVATKPVKRKKIWRMKDVPTVGNSLSTGGTKKN